MNVSEKYSIGINEPTPKDKNKNIKIRVIIIEWFEFIKFENNIPIIDISKIIGKIAIENRIIWFNVIIMLDANWVIKKSEIKNWTYDKHNDTIVKYIL